MKKSLSLLVLAALLAGACAPTVYFDKSADTNFVPFKTYAFLRKADSTKVSVYNSEIIDELIHKSIVAELNSRNYSVDTKTPDLLIKFHLMVENHEEIVNNPNYMYPPMMYGPYRYPYYYYPGPVYNSFRTIHYKDGTLIIDMIDRQSGKLVWRGWSESDIDNLPRFEKHLPDMITRIMANYPIPKRGN